MGEYQMASIWEEMCGRVRDNRNIDCASPLIMP